MGQGLRDGYGVLLGTLEDYLRDDPNDFGRYMHGVLTVGAGGQHYHCAVDVDTLHGSVPIHWRIHPMRIGEWGALLSLADGWHMLASEPDSGAVDYIRDPRLAELLLLPDYMEREPLFRLPNERIVASLPHLRRIDAKLTRDEMVSTETALVRYPLGAFVEETHRLTLRAMTGTVALIHPPWNGGTSEQALTDLEAVIFGAQRIMVFGEPFTHGRGVHNIHQNQGDPISSSHAAENGIWQDGITIAIRADGTASAFMNKFDGQVDQTNNTGAPLP